METFVQVYSDRIVCKICLVTKCKQKVSSFLWSAQVYGPLHLPLEIATPLQSCSLVGHESLQSAPNVNLNLGLVTERHVINKQNSV